MATKWTLKTIQAPIGGLDVSQGADMIADNASPDLSNVFFDQRQVKSETGYITFGIAIRGYPQIAYQIFYTDGTSELVLITTATMYTWHSVLLEWQYVSGGQSDTTLNGGHNGGATTINVNNAAGFVDGDYIAIELDTGGQHQSTVDGAPVGNAITIDDALPGSGLVAANGKPVFEPVVLNGQDDFPVSVAAWVPDDSILIANNVDNVKVYDGSTCEDVSNLPSGGNCTARAVAVFNNYAVLLGTTEGGTARPQRVRWSDTADITEWTAGNAGYQDLWDSEDFIQTSSPLGPYLVIYRERSIYRVDYVGSVSTLFNFDAMVTGEGAISSRAIANFGDYHIIFGNANLYRYDGGFDIDPVGDVIFDHVFASGGLLNTKRSARMFCVFLEEIDEAWFFIPSGSDDIPAYVLRYMDENKSFSIREFGTDFSGYGFYQLAISRPWSSLIGSWAEQDWRWSDRALLSDAPTTLLCGYTDLQIYEYDYLSANDNGIDIDWHWISKDFSLPDSEVRHDLLEFEAKGSTVNVSYSTDQGLTWNLIEAVSLSPVFTRYRLFKQFISRKYRYKFAGSNSGFALKWLATRLREESRW